MKRSFRQSAIQVLENSVVLLIKTAPATLPAYYIGSMPFILGLLYFIGDMSRNPFAGRYCAVAALGLSLLFVWMKCWQVRFASLLRAALAGEPPPQPALGPTLTMIARQTLIQGTGFVVLPFALLLMLPYAWCYAFYQNATAIGADAEDGLIGDCRRAWQQALLWPRQNHLVLAIMSLFGSVAFINIAVALYVLPHAVKRFVAVETVFTLTGSGVINTTFLAVTTALAYLCLDPIIKAAYVLRCYHGEAVKTGVDLKSRLTRIKSPAAVGLAVWALVVLAMPPAPAAAQGQPKTQTQVSGPSGPVTPDDLDQTIRKVLQQREFAWRMPRDAGDSQTRQRGPVGSAIEWTLDKLADAAGWLWNQVERLADWIDRIMPDRRSHVPGQSSGPRISARTLLIVLLLLVAGLAGFFVFRNWRPRGPVESEEQTIVAVHEPDLTDESLKADALPVQRWLEMARKLQQKGSYQLAIRALYLATLSYLAGKDVITIRIYKSNRDYLHELAGRAADQGRVLECFGSMVRIFEKIWYGRYPASEKDYENYAAIQQSITGGSDAA